MTSSAWEEPWNDGDEEDDERESPRRPSARPAGPARSALRPVEQAAAKWLARRLVLPVVPPVLYYLAFAMALVILATVVTDLLQQSAAQTGADAKRLDMTKLCKNEMDRPGGEDPPCIPQYLVQVVVAAVARYGCPEISAPTIAAQISAESRWNPVARSPAGALGVAQFMPDTWTSKAPDGQPFGQDFDQDGNGGPTDPQDAIMAMVRYDCYLVGVLDDQIADCEKLTKGGWRPETLLPDKIREGLDTLGEIGLYPGEDCIRYSGPISLVLAGYNAGSGAVYRHAGIPPWDETKQYVERVMNWAEQYTEKPKPLTASAAAQKAIARALQARGSWYSYGGTCDSPLGGNPALWCDCSSLVQAAWRAAGVNLPRTTYQQVDSPLVAPVASVAELQPGDLIFRIGDTPRRPNGHVGLYIGPYQDGTTRIPDAVIQAPYTNRQVEVVPLAKYLNGNPPTIRRVKVPPA